MKSNRLGLIFLLIVFSPSVPAATKSPKVKAFEDRLAKPEKSVAWLSETTVILVKDFSKDPDAAASLSAFLLARENIIGPLSETCNKEAGAFAGLASELDLEVDQGLELAGKSSKHAAILAAKKGLVERLKDCLKTGLSFEDA